MAVVGYIVAVVGYIGVVVGCIVAVVDILEGVPIKILREDLVGSRLGVPAKSLLEVIADSHCLLAFVGQGW